jgi:transaldolase
VKLCIDTFNEDVLAEVLESGLIYGLTMNPKVMAEEGETDYYDRLYRMSRKVEGPVSVQVISRDKQGMLEEGRVLSEINDNIHVKIALDSPTACSVINELNAQGIKTTATIIYNVAQAYLAAEAGASIVALFEGGLHGITKNPINLNESIRISMARPVKQIMDLHNYKTKVLVGAREPIQLVEAALAGVDLCTVKLPVFEQLFGDHETSFRINEFNSAWQEVYGDCNWLKR